MPDVTVYGAGSGSARQVVTIPLGSTALQQAAQLALQGISAALAPASGAPSIAAVTYDWSGYLPVTGIPTELVLHNGAVDTISPGSSYAAIVVDAVTPVSIFNAAGGDTTVVSGIGGLGYTVRGGGSQTVLMGGGHNSVDIGGDVAATVHAGGTSTVSAYGGRALIYVDAGEHDGLIGVGGSDTVNLSGKTDLVSILNSPTLLQQDGSSDFYGVLDGGVPIVQTAPGTEVIGALAGSTVFVLGASALNAGSITVTQATGGNLLINPRNQNVTVFGGAGSTTLFGAGDLGGQAINTGSDFVVSGTGYFHGGAGVNFMTTSTQAGRSTLVGDGAIDFLFSQGAGNTLRAGPNTVVANAAGATFPGIITVGGAAGGVVLDAGSGANVLMFGAVTGSNTIIAGSGSAMVYGNHAGTPTDGNVYRDGHAGGALTIGDFLVGHDRIALSGAAPTAFSYFPSVGAGTMVTLSDGTKITLLGVHIDASNIGSIFG